MSKASEWIVAVNEFERDKKSKIVFETIDNKQRKPTEFLIRENVFARWIYFFASAFRPRQPRRVKNLDETNRNSRNFLVSNFNFYRFFHPRTFRLNHPQCQSTFLYRLRLWLKLWGSCDAINSFSLITFPRINLSLTFHLALNWIKCSDENLFLTSFLFIACFEILRSWRGFRVLNEISDKFN